MGNTKAIKKSYNASAFVYDSRYRDIQFDKYKTMLKNIELKEPILDLGCGTGLLKEFLGKKVQVYGCDFSENMLEIARKRGEITEVCDLNGKLPYEDEKFATILSFTVLQNIENQNGFLKEAKRILKKDGVFVLTALKKVTDEKKLIKLLKKYFNIQELTDCGEDLGFVLRKTKPVQKA